MKRATAIIGANFGDEGKGLVTDYCCAALGPDALVVRFNGGAQAGHTVVTPDGKRHVFSHYGSGHFIGCDTYLSRFFVTNPILWEKEHDELTKKKLDQNAVLYADWASPLTTPYDMLLNQEQEFKARAHGSCGAGINATMQRCKEPALATYVSDLLHPRRLTDKLYAIRDKVAQTLTQMGSRPSAYELLHSQDLMDRFMRSCSAFRSFVLITGDSMLSTTEHLVFEGAQGLLLDQDHRFFPHVTHSKTGLKNVVALATAGEVDAIDAIYVTRTYMTRHGDGPFPTEDPAMRFGDDTNVTGTYQGPLRFGKLDVPLLNESIMNDLKTPTGGIKITPCLAITHLDQVVGENLKNRDLFGGSLPERLIIGTGPTRANVHEGVRGAIKSEEEHLLGSRG